MSNAIKYSPDGGVVNISAHGTGDWVRLIVQDTGMGMSPEDAAKVFRRFFRTESAREAAIPGAGLGLSITKTILERHGGDHLPAPAPGQGQHLHPDPPCRGRAPF